MLESEIVRGEHTHVYRPPFLVQVFATTRRGAPGYRQHATSKLNVWYCVSSARDRKVSPPIRRAQWCMMQCMWLQSVRPRE